MNPAYRRDNACACVPPRTAPKKTVPIARFDVRSFITNVKDGARPRAGERPRTPEQEPVVLAHPLVIAGFRRTEASVCKSVDRAVSFHRW
jgi:hypothetical protein